MNPDYYHARMFGNRTWTTNTTNDAPLSRGWTADDIYQTLRQIRDLPETVVCPDEELEQF